MNYKHCPNLRPWTMVDICWAFLFSLSWHRPVIAVYNARDECGRTRYMFWVDAEVIAIRKANQHIYPHLVYLGRNITYEPQHKSCFCHLHIPTRYDTGKYFVTKELYIFMTQSPFFDNGKRANMWRLHLVSDCWLSKGHRFLGNSSHPKGKPSEATKVNHKNKNKYVSVSGDHRGCVNIFKCVYIYKKNNYDWFPYKKLINFKLH